MKFEKELRDIELKINELEIFSKEKDIDLSGEIAR